MECTIVKLLMVLDCTGSQENNLQSVELNHHKGRLDFTQTSLILA